MEGPRIVTLQSDDAVQAERAGSAASAAPESGAFFSELLRSRASEIDAAEGRAQATRSTWEALLAGHLAIVDSFYSATRWFLVLQPAAGVPVTATARKLLEDVLLGESQKCAAMNAGLSTSSISTIVHRALDRMGASFTPRQAPAFLSLLAREGMGAAVPTARFSVFARAPFEYRIVSVMRPELALAPALPRAEYEILCRIVEGQSHAEISKERRRSARTVANQVSAVFRRLGVSSRAQLIAKLLANATHAPGEEWEATQRRAG
jgi:DNA-binding NarL/FixJ family response regulator